VDQPTGARTTDGASGATPQASSQTRAKKPRSKRRISSEGAASPSNEKATETRLRA
jgi:hypothetical protein